jgi:hypothetical protein
VVAIAALPAEVGEAAGALAQEVREMEAAPAWLTRVRRIFSRDDASARDGRPQKNKTGWGTPSQL